jgi:hypothetical protein
MANPPSIGPTTNPMTTSPFSGAATTAPAGGPNANQQALLQRAGQVPQMSPEQARAYMAYANNTVQPDIDTLKNGGGLANMAAMQQLMNNDYQNAMTLATQMQNDGKLSPSDRMAALRQMQQHPIPPEAGSLTSAFANARQERLTQDAVNGATTPQSGDSQQTADAKSDYRSAFQLAQQERQQATNLMRQLGPGTHQVGDDKVDIKQGKDGCGRDSFTVSITHKDGSTRTTTVTGQEVNTESTDAGGRKSSVFSNGTFVQAQGPGGGRQYNVNNEGHMEAGTVGG